MDDPGPLGPLRPLLEAPPRSAVLSDFDGTLSAIVDDPEQAVAFPGTVDVLARLATRFGAVAVVSGRPAAFLRRALAGAGPAVRLFGVYGFERVEDGQVRVAPEAEPWLGVAAAVEAAARGRAPAGLGVERKGPALALHWRRAPGAEPWAQDFARRWAEDTGLVVQPGRRALELRPPVPLDKGRVVEEVAGGMAAACFVGDDAGDLLAFDALDRLVRAGTAGVRVAVADEESPPELLARADVVVDGPAEALALLTGLAEAAASDGGG